MRRLVVVACVVLLAGFGLGLLVGSLAIPANHTHTRVQVKSVQQPPLANEPLGQRCPAGKGYMGCAAGVAPSASTKELGALGKTGHRLFGLGRVFVDVSSWQGCSINWAAVGVPGAGVKAFQNVPDPCFAHNVQSLEAAHKLWAPYLYVDGCGGGPGFIATIRSVGGLRSLRPILDAEQPNARGCIGLLARQIYAAFHVWSDIYTAPGTWPGGGHDGLSLFVATYGRSFNSCFFSDGCAHVVAWQDAAPPFCNFGPTGCFVIDGMQVDTDIDYGMLEERAIPLPPPNLQHYERYERGPFRVADVLGHALVRGLLLYERSLAQSYDAKRPHWPEHHRELVNIRYKLQWLALRLEYGTRGSAYYRHERYGELVSRGFRAEQCPSWAACLHPKRR